MFYHSTRKLRQGPLIIPDSFGGAWGYNFHCLLWKLWSKAPFIPLLWNRKLAYIAGCCESRRNNMRQTLMYTLNRAIWAGYGETSLTDPFSQYLGAVSYLMWCHTLSICPCDLPRTCTHLSPSWFTSCRSFMGHKHGFLCLLDPFWGWLRGTDLTWKSREE